MSSFAPPTTGRFEILRQLGEGGMGVVFEAFDRVRRETVALKTLRDPSAEAIYRMKREFRSLAELEHPNLVRLLDLFVEVDRCFFTMELVDGVDLAAYVAPEDPDDGLTSTIDMASFVPFDEPSLRHALVGLTRGLDALHAAGLLHRDLKPSNVRVTPQGRVVLLDFGLVVDAHASVQQTHEGTIVGTVQYMSPEQARGETELTRACDLYSLGVVLYELLTTRLPFDGPALKLLSAKQTDEPLRPSRIVQGIPRDLEELCLGLLARDPLARPALDRVRAIADAGATSRPSKSVPSSSRRAPSAIVGRDAELAQLRALHRVTSSGRPALGLVVGASGMGKSALLQAFAREVEVRDTAVVLVGRCYETESVAFKGLDGLVDSLSRVLAMASPEQLGRMLPPNLADLATIFPVLRRVRPIGAAYARRSGSDRGREETRLRGFACLRELLRRIGEERCLVVVVDDVQWADEDSARGIVELLRGADPPTATFVFGARPHDDAPVIRDVFGDAANASLEAIERRTVPLGPLSTDAIRALVRRELGGDDDAADAVAREARGIPFAAIELTRFLGESVADDPSFESVEADSTDDGSPSIDRYVRRRVARLDTAARCLLEMLAIAGEPTPSQVLLGALGTAEDDRSPIDALRVRAFVRTIRSGGRTLVDTSHDRIREAVVASIDGVALAERHRALAVSMEGLESPPHDRLARHFHAAGDRASAHIHAVAAAEDAIEALAFDRAAELYALAIDASDGDERKALLVPRAEALDAAGRFLDGARAWNEASEGANPTESRRRRRLAAESLLRAGHLDEGISALARVSGELGARIPSGRFAALWEIAKLHVLLFFRGRGFVPRHQTASVSSDLERVQTLAVIATEYAPIDPFRGFVPVLRLVRSALEVGDVESLAIGLGVEAAIVAAFGAQARATKLHAALERFAVDHTSERARLLALTVRIWVEFFRGGRHAALAISDEVVDSLERERGTPPWLASVAYFARGTVLLHDLRPARYSQIVDFVDRREALAGPYAEIRIRCFAVPVFELVSGRPERVLVSSTEIRERIGVDGDYGFVFGADLHRAWALLYLDSAEQATPIMDFVRDGFVRTGAWRISIIRSAWCVHRAAIALRCGDDRRLEAASRDARGVLGPYAATAAAFVAALAAQRSADVGEVLGRLSDVVDLAHASGLETYEVASLWARARLAPESTRQVFRDAYLACIEATGLVDPDRFCWSMFPIGDPPPRTGTTRSGWSTSTSSIDAVVAT